MRSRCVGGKVAKQQCVGALLKIKDMIDKVALLPT